MRILYLAEPCYWKCQLKLNKVMKLGILSNMETIKRSILHIGFVLITVLLNSIYGNERENEKEEY